MACIPPCPQGVRSGTLGGMTAKTKPNYVVPEEKLEELIHKYCRDLNALNRQGIYDPITGRDKEIEQSVLILLQKGRKNVMLLAPAGVGKTALVIGLSQKILAGQVPALLKNARLLEVDLPAMAAGTSGPAEFQERFIPVCRGLAERYYEPDRPRVILFMDEIHTIMPNCEGSAYRGLSEVMKPYLTVGNLCVMGATTKDEYRMYVGLDPALDRRFQKVELNVPNEEETVRILMNIKAGYEKHHGIEIPEDMCRLVVSLTSEHMRKRNQPDKSIIVMDGACAKQVMDHGTGGKLEKEAIFYFMSAETGLLPNAFG